MLSEDDNEHDGDDDNVHNGDGADDIDINNSSKRSITETDSVASLNDDMLSNYPNFLQRDKKNKRQTVLQ